MRKENKRTDINTKVTLLIRKTCVVLTLAVACATVSPKGAILNSYQVVEAATKSLSTIVPTVSIQSRSGQTATLTIDSVNNASYYRVYRSTSASGTYSYVGNTSSLKFVDSGLKSGSTYYYKIKAYNSSSSSKYSKSVKVNATLSKVVNLKGSYSNQGATLTWSKLTGASKYKVYRATSKNGDYDYLGSTTSTSYTDKTAKAGATYYYRVRGMKTVSNIKYNGVYSSKISVACTVNQVENESENSYIDEVLRLVNIERTQRGLSELTTTTALKNAANQRAIEIKSVFDHTRPDGSSCFTVLDEFNVSYRAAGENIAYGQKTPEEVVDGWMNSEGHRANILSSKFGKLGVGCYYSNGTYYWSQLFTN